MIEKKKFWKHNQVKKKKKSHKPTGIKKQTNKKPHLSLTPARHLLFSFKSHLVCVSSIKRV